MANADGFDEGLSHVLELVRGRWRIRIIRQLLGGPQRPGSLARSLRTVAKNRLHQNLRELEKLGVIQRKAYEGRVPRVEYSLTPLGVSLKPVVESLATWGERHGRLLVR